MDTAARAREIFNAWNEGDMDRFLGYHAEGLEVTSPVNVKYRGTATLRGMDLIGEFWRELVAKHGVIRHDIVDILAGVDSAIVYYRSSATGGTVADAFWFDADGKVAKLVVFYGQTTGS